MIGYLRVSLIIDQSECLVCFFLCTELTLFCTELTLFCTELPENCIYLNQSELNNFSMYIIMRETGSLINSPFIHYYLIEKIFSRNPTQLVPLRQKRIQSTRYQHIPGNNKLSDLKNVKNIRIIILPYYEAE